MPAPHTQPRQHVVTSDEGPTDERIRYGRRRKRVYPHRSSIYIASDAAESARPVEGSYLAFSYQTTLFVGLVPIETMSASPSPSRSPTSMPETATPPVSSGILFQVPVVGSYR